ncbi:MAG TPA: flagellar motor protein [Bryobacteraceae bacterium]|nr:flagellar motor protein [Bryobacteraceae bacterium]
MASKKQHQKLDRATLGGIVLALSGIVGGLLLEKGSIKDVAQFTAALIVVGGTIGALLVTTPWETLKLGISRWKLIFFESQYAPGQLIEEMITYSIKARTKGLASLELDATTIKDEFLRKALNLAADGSGVAELKTTMELELDAFEHRSEEAARVYESGGGYAPTVGIIGAVLGLIQVMKNLANIEGVGHGIAVAFVATIYGVGLANILLLPAAGKIRARSRMEVHRRELILNGVIGIVEGVNPRVLRNRLNAYLSETQAKPSSRLGTAQRAA